MKHSYQKKKKQEKIILITISSGVVALKYLNLIIVVEFAIWAKLKKSLKELIQKLNWIK